MPRFSWMEALKGLIGSAALVGVCGASPLVIEKEGSFTAGGTVIGDPAMGTLHCDHGFVDYQIPVHAKKTALFMWHSSSVQVWQTRWDGGDGFQQIFLRRGYPVYLWDGPRVGRGNMSCELYTYKPVVGQDGRNIIAWRFGPKTGQWFPGVQFPVNDAAALERAQSMRYDELSRSLISTTTRLPIRWRCS